MIGANSLSKSVQEAKTKAIQRKESSESSDSEYLDIFSTSSVSDAASIRTVACSSSSSIEEVPFNEIDNELEDDVLIKSTDNSIRRRVQAKVQNNLPKRVAKYVSDGRFPKHVKIFLLALSMTFTAHMMCIAIGMYQMSLIDPSTIVIRRFHLKDLDKAQGALEVVAFIPMPWMARFFHIKVAQPNVQVFAEDKNLFIVEFPDVIVGRKGAKVHLDGINFKSNSIPDQSLASIVLQHVLPKGIIKGRPVKRLRVVVNARLQTSSFWYPLDIAVNMEEKLDLLALKEQLLAKKAADEDSELPALSSVKVISSDRNSLDTKVLATVKLPPHVLASFMTIDVPEVLGEVSLITGREKTPLFLGIGRIVPTQLNGSLIKLLDEFRLEASLTEKSEKALRHILASMRDKDFNMIARFQVNPTESSFISQILAVDMRLNVMELMKEFEASSKKPERLVKRGFTFRSISEAPVSMMSSLKLRAQDLALEYPNHPVATVHLKSLLAEPNEARVRVLLTVSRKAISFMSGLDLRLFEGDIPEFASNIYAELDHHGKLRKKRLGKVVMSAKSCRTGSKDFQMSLVLSVHTGVLRDLIFKAGTRTLMIKRSGSNLFSLAMDAFETCIQLGPNSLSPDVFLTKKRSSHDHWSGQTFRNFQKVFNVHSGLLNRRRHDLRLGVSTDDTNISAAIGLAFSPKPAVEAWPFARVEWSHFRFLLRPNFNKRKLDRLYRNTTLASIELLQGGTDVLLRPTHSPLSLIHNGAVQVRFGLARHGKRWPKANVLDLVKLLLREYRPGTVRSLALYHSRPGQADRLVRVAYEQALAYAKGTIFKGDISKKAESFVRMDEQMQISVAGLSNARVNLLVPTPDTARLKIPRKFRSDAFWVSISLPPIRALICDSKKERCPASVGIDALSLKCRVAHGRRLDLRTNQESSRLNNYLLAFAHLHSFTDLFGFAESAISNPDINISLGSDSSTLPWTKVTLLDRLVNAVGSMARIPLPAMPARLRLPPRKRNSLKYQPREALKLLTRVSSPNPRNLNARVLLRLPSSMVESAGSSNSPSEPSQLFILRWGDLRVKFIVNGLGSAEIELKQGKFGLHLNRLIKGKLKGLQGMISTQTRNLDLRFALELFPTATSFFRAQTIRDTISSALYYLDIGVGLLFPRLKHCTGRRSCRSLIRDSRLLKAGIEKLMDAEVAMEVEHESIKSFLGGHTMSRVLYVKRGLAMLRSLWVRYGKKIISKCKSLNIDLDRLMRASVLLLPHPETRGRFAKVPAIIPQFSDPKKIGLVTERPLARAILRVQGLMAHGTQAIVNGVRTLYEVLDTPHRPPMYLLWDARISPMTIAAGINRVDTVELRTAPVRLQRRINIKTCGLDSDLIELEADVFLPKDMSETAGFFGPFGLSSLGQIAVDEQPKVRITPETLALPYNSPMNLGLDATRASNANMLSVLISFLPEIPIFPVTCQVDPFAFALELLLIERHSLKFKFSGLRFYNPLPAISMDMGDSLDVLVTFKNIPFVKLLFGPTMLLPGSNPLVADLVFSKTAFSHPGNESHAERIKEALDELLSLGASGKPIDLVMYIAVSNALVLQASLRIPARALPDLGEIMQSSSAPSDDMMTEAMRAARQLGADMRRDVLERVQNQWTSFVASWVRPARAEEAAPRGILRNRPALFDLRFPYTFPWETSVLALDVKLTLDKPSQLCPSIIPTVDTSTADFSFRREPISADLERCPALVTAAPGERVSLVHGLVSYDDLPSAKFALQLASNYFKRGSICTSVKVNRVVLRLSDPEGETFVLDTAISGLPHIGQSWDPALRPCRPDPELCIPKLEDPLQEDLHHFLLPESVSTLSGPEKILIISKRLDLYGSYQASIMFMHSERTDAIGFRLISFEEGIALSLKIHTKTGKAELIRGNEPDPLKLISTGTYPLLPDTEEMLTITLKLQPVEGLLTCSIHSHRLPENTWAAFQWTGFRLPDYLPRDSNLAGLTIAFIAEGPGDIRTSGYALRPYKPSVKSSGLFHLRSKSVRVMERGTAILELRDSCRHRIGRLHVQLEIALVRATDVWDHAPYPVKSTLYQYQPLMAYPVFQNFHRLTNADDVVYPRKIRFDPAGGAYRFDFVGTAPGRYRVFVKYEEAWHLLQFHHIFIRNI